MTIMLLIGGGMRYATVEAEMIGGSWLIDDVSYDAGEGLRPYLLRCAVAPCRAGPRRQHCEGLA